jgi:hypothetical protein
MVTYHYVKFYVSIIIYLEVININVQNFNFLIENYLELWVGQMWGVGVYLSELC